MLKAENICIKTDDNVLLKDVSIHINEGECVSIFGPSGSGKSTLMSILSGIIRSNKGSITLNGKSIHDYDIYEYRRKVRYIPPKPDFFIGKVKEHFKTLFSFLPIEEQAGFEKLKSILPALDLDDNVLNKKTDDISTGEGKRLFILQNFLIDADIFLIDEVFTGLDPSLVEKAFTMIKDNGKAVLLTSHNVDFMRKKSDRAVFIKGGRIIETTDNFFKNTTNKEIITYLKGGEN